MSDLSDLGSRFQSAYRTVSARERRFSFSRIRVSVRLDRLRADTKGCANFSRRIGRASARGELAVAFARGAVAEALLPRRASSRPSLRPGSRRRRPFSAARIPLIRSVGALDSRRYAVAPDENVDFTRSGLVSRDSTTIPASGSRFRYRGNCHEHVSCDVGDVEDNDLGPALQR